MINSKMYELGSRRSVIREIFEYGKKRKAEIGEDKVFDFSIGNPSVESPEAVTERIRELLEVHPSTAVHGYTSAQGDPNARQAIADDLNRRFNTSFSGNNVYLTCGAAASLTISLRSIIDADDQNVMVFAPFFTEYRVFIESMGAQISVVPASFPKLDLNLDACGEIQAHQRFHGLGAGIVDVDQALVGAALELLPAVLVLVNSAQDGDDLGLGGQRNGPGDLRLGTLRGLDDLLGRLVDELVIVRLEANADHLFVCHVVFPPLRI